MRIGLPGSSVARVINACGSADGLGRDAQGWMNTFEIVANYSATQLQLGNERVQSHLGLLPTALQDIGYLRQSDIRAALNSLTASRNGSGDEEFVKCAPDDSCLGHAFSSCPRPQGRPNLTESPVRGPRCRGQGTSTRHEPQRRPTRQCHRVAQDAWAVVIQSLPRIGPAIGHLDTRCPGTSTVVRRASNLTTVLQHNSNPRYEVGGPRPTQISRRLFVRPHASRYTKVYSRLRAKVSSGSGRPHLESKKYNPSW